MDRAPFIALDGSTVVEVVRPEDGTGRMSVGRARVRAGQRTTRHLHRVSDEVYYVLGGRAVVYVGGRVSILSPGEALVIPAGAEHFLEAVGGPVEVLCVCSPPYEDADTELLEAVV